MNRILALLTVGAFAGAAFADVPPPPPPKGKKYVSVSSEVVLGKDVAGYVFVKQVTSFPGRPKPTYAKVELNTEKPTAIPEPARRTFVTLFAVPRDAAKGFKTDDELFDALGANKVKGAHHISFTSTATVSDKVKADSVKWTYTITAIDPKDGIKTKVEGEGYEPPTEKPKRNGEGKDSPEDDAPTAAVPAPRGGTWVAGLAAFGALTLGGLWLAGRGRRKV
ncbi:MAG: hypothetical protein J0I06_02785 [Planctomycetes bacterium]|nr:hypothetical protein [Planctomycetota bacterium]